MAGELIFIIDDNQLNLELATYLLKFHGYEVQTATDAGTALLTLADLNPQLILMDIQLPGIDGLQLTSDLKKDPKYQAIPIIAITAFAMKGDREKALAAGCDGYITKPIDTTTFPTIIAGFLKANKNSR